jgi:activator of HSP90 ATPase
MMTAANNNNSESNPTSAINTSNINKHSIVTGANWKNVNNWHWVEKNCLPWAREYLTEKLLAISVEDGSQSARIERVDKIEGDVDVNVRKGKVIYLFDLTLEMNWAGRTVDGQECGGGITMRDCSFDDEPEEYEVEMSCKREAEATRRILFETLVKKQLRQLINGVFRQFPKDLIAAHGPDLLVKADASKQQQQSQQAAGSVPSSAAASAVVEEKKAAAATEKKKATPVSLSNTVTITLTTEFKCSAMDLYAALTDESRVAAWTRSKPAIHPHAGGTFSMMDGQVSGRFESVVPGETLVQKWRLKQWPEGIMGIIT